MNTRVIIGRASSRLAPVLLMTVVAIGLDCARADAGCGSNLARPVVAIAWQHPSNLAQTPTPREVPPRCSGLNCSGRPILPVVTSPAPEPFRDLTTAILHRFFLDRPTQSGLSQSEGLNPIGRVTEIERPPCRQAAVVQSGSRP